MFGFLVEDIRQEIRRSARLVRQFRFDDENRQMMGQTASHVCCVFQTCCCCKKKGACVGCNVRSCRKSVHFPCGRKQKFISQFTGMFP